MVKKQDSKESFTYSYMRFVPSQLKIQHVDLIENPKIEITTNWCLERFVAFHLNKILTMSSMPRIDLKKTVMKQDVIEEIKSKKPYLRSILRTCTADRSTDPYLYTVDRFTVLLHRFCHFKSNWFNHHLRDYTYSYNITKPRSGFFIFTSSQMLEFSKPVGGCGIVEELADCVNIFNQSYDQ
jgi:hypothetical protein